MKKLGHIMRLFISKEENKQRVEKNLIILDEKGILEDKFYNKDIQRSVLITSEKSYGLLKAHHISIPFSALGENLLIDYNPYYLTPGTKLHIGSCILEISQYCTICNHLASIDKRVPSLLKKNRGIFAKVIKNGEIKRGDDIFITKEQDLMSCS